MSYFNDIIQTYFTHYASALGYADLIVVLETEKIPTREIAARLLEFADKMFAQGVVDEENEVFIGKIDVDMYDIEKACVTINAFVDAQGFGDLLDLD